LIADFGYIKLDGVIGDTVYEDVNANGVYDAGVDVPIDGVSVNAYEDNGTTPNQLDGWDTLVVPTTAGSSTQVTGSSNVIHSVLGPLSPLPGKYWFGAEDGVAHDIDGETYILEVDSSNFAPSAVLDPAVWIPFTYEDATSTAGSTANGHGKDDSSYATTITTSATDTERVDLTGDFGYIRKNGEVGGIIFEDTDGNGIYLAGTDTPIDNVSISLYIDDGGSGSNDLSGANGTLESATDTLIGTQDTASGANPAGEYLFDNLDPRATYFVVVNTNDPDLAAQFVASGGNFIHTTGPTPGADNNSQANDELADGGYTIVLETTADINDRQDYTGDFWYSGFGEIGDFAFADLNVNGFFDGSDTALSGVTIAIYEDDGDGINEIGGDDIPYDVDLITAGVQNTEVTDGTGAYLFRNINPVNSYWIRVEWTNIAYPYNAPLWTVGINGHNQESTGVLVNSTATPINHTLDFGFVDNVGQIGNVVFFDVDEDGSYTPGDTLVDNIQIQLYQDLPGGSAPGVRDSGDTLVGTQLSGVPWGNAAGEYLFTSLDPTATYFVVLTDVNGVYAGNTYSPSVGSGNTDGIGKLHGGYEIDLSAASASAFIDLTGDFWFKQVDNNGQGGSPSPGGWGGGSNYYSSIGDTVWWDENGDGVRDQSEQPIGNATVILRDTTNTIVATLETDITGTYLFDDLDEGVYTVEIDTSTLPHEYSDSCTSIEQDADTQVTCSTTPITYFVTLGEENNYRDADFGFQKNTIEESEDPEVPEIPKDLPNSIGDTVWWDENGDGVQDPGEEGIPNHLVYLRNEEGRIIKMVITNENGEYLFNNLSPDTYIVDVNLDSLEDGVTISTVHTYTVILNEGESYYDADFGLTAGEKTVPLGKVKLNTFVLPALLAQTGTPLAEKGVATLPSPYVNTTPPSWAAPSSSEDIAYWQDILPADQDKGAEQYVVLPTLWVAAPVNYIPKNASHYSDIAKDGVTMKDYSVTGGENYLSYLDRGLMHYPGTLEIWDTYSEDGKDYEYTGNTVIFWHSSYWTRNEGDYQTVFGLLPTLDPGEEVWVYNKKEDGEYELRKYEITNSYETTPSDTKVLLADENSANQHLTLFTCTPIGGISGRWIIKAQRVDTKNTNAHATSQTQEEDKKPEEILSEDLKRRLKELLDRYKKRNEDTPEKIEALKERIRQRVQHSSTVLSELQWAVLEFALEEL
jgi:LPXTG-site transpeptidase (sortase) family protein